MFLDREDNLENLFFRELHSQVLIGTASDRYAGWIGQIYSPDHYQGRISRRTKVIGGKPFIEEVLPIDSVEEYFHHFPVLEIDFTFYQPLFDQNGQITQCHNVLKTYSRHLKHNDRIILKVPQMLTAQKIHKGDQYLENPTYLNPKIFTEQFYEPALTLLGSNLTGFIFEQEYQRQIDRSPVIKMARDLDKFFCQIPRDPRYHLELRTELYLRDQIFEVLSKHGVGQVLSHWTWLPPLRKQIAKANGRFFNYANELMIRLMTPLEMRYEDAYSNSYPFDKMVEEILQPEMILDTVEILKEAIGKGVLVNLIVNNRAGGNAPLIAREIAEKFVPKPAPKTKEQMRLW